MPSSSTGPEAVEDLVDPLAGEEPDQVVLGGEEEARLAGVALAPGAPAKLVVDPPRLVALGAADEQPAELAHLVALGLRLLLEALRHARRTPSSQLSSLGRDAELAQLVGRELLRVAAELDVDAAAGHVGRDRDRAEPARLGDGLALALGVLGLRVQDLVLDPGTRELARQHLRDLDRDRADEHRLALLVALADLVDHRPPLALLRLVDLVVVVGPDHRPVGLDLDHRHLVDLHELGRLGERGPGHPAELLVEAEVVLERDRRERLVLLADRARPPWPRPPGAGRPTSAGPRGCGR